MAERRNIVLSVMTRAIVCVALLAGALGAAYLLTYLKPKPAHSGASTAAPRVVVLHAQPVPVRREWEGFGTAIAMESANVPARVTATVIERPEEIRPGRSVTQGQLLVQLDDSDFARQVEIAAQAIEDIDAQLLRLDVEEQSWTRRAGIAEEDVRLATSEYERVQKALASDAANERELDFARQSLNVAVRTEVAAREELDKIAPRRASLKAQRLSEEAALRLARQNLERSRIVSPINGVLQSVDVEEGENLVAGQRVARVVNPHWVEVPLLLPAGARPYVAVGDEVILTDAGSGNQAWFAQVTRIGPQDDEATRTMTVYTEVRSDGNSKALPPGRFVQGIVRAGKAHERWVVPRRAIEGERLVLIEDGRVRTRGVEVDYQVHAEFPAFGLPDRIWMVLRDPLPSGALVVVDPSRGFAEGNPAVPVIASQATALAPSDVDDKSSDSARDPEGLSP